MGSQTSFHAPGGAADFLGWRRRRGETEIVYDDGVTRHMVWRLACGSLDERELSEALRTAVESRHILPALHDELRKRAIAIERVGDSPGG